MDKVLFVSDLDGTLLGPDAKMSAESVSMLNEAIGHGALFSVATARTPSTVAALLKEISLNLPLVVMTGAAQWNPANGTFSNAVTMEPEDAGKILASIRRHNLPAFVYTLRDDKIHIYHTGPLSDRERTFIDERDASRYKRFHIRPDGESEIPDPLTDVVLFYVMQPTAQVEKAYNDIRDNCRCNAVFYHDMYGPEIGMMEIFAPEASKARAVCRLRRISGADRVVAFGDNINDIPMLKEADVAVAVENAVPEVKAVADIVIGPNTSDSVARFILESVVSLES